jgi:hypothetical protein
MTQLVSSPSTQKLIVLALSDPGAKNINNLNAYNAIYGDLLANGNINSGTLQWFAQAGLVNTQQFGPSNAQGTFIWNYTIAAAASEGAIITIPELQTVSNNIASTVFKTLSGASFSFDDKGNFSPNSIISDDAGVGIAALQVDHREANLDFAIWGGSLFARTELGDPTYFSDNKINLTPGSPDANAILSGFAAGSIAVLAEGGNTLSTGLSNIDNLDELAIGNILGPSGAAVLLTIPALGGALTLSESDVCLANS